MKTLEVHIPDDLAVLLARQAVDEEAFVLESLRLRLAKIEEVSKLAEEYKAAAAENRALEDDWSDSFPAEGPPLSQDDLAARLKKAEKSQSYSLDQAKAILGL